MKKLAFLLLILLLFSLNTIADEHEDEDEGDDDNEDLGEQMGNITLFLLGLGFLYVVLRRAFVVSKQLNPEFDHVKENMLDLYRRFRKPLLNLHSIILVVATITAGIHGIVLMDNELSDTLTGWIAFGFMVLISISGIIIYFRYNPIWKYRDAKTILKFVHRQWLFTIIGGIFLLIHIE